MSESVVYNMDCMEYMRTLPDKAFDLAIVDPPYGDGNGGSANASAVCLALCTARTPALMSLMPTREREREERRCAAV